MGFSLAQVKKTRSDIPERITIIGAQKVGKSTFGSCAPAPIFIPTEDGLENIDTDAFPLCKSWDDVMSAIAALYNDKHDFKTVVLDSADWAEKLLHQHVVALENKPNLKNIEDFGYGKGYAHAAAHFSQLLDGLNTLRTERGMRVIVLCHAEIKRFDDPLSNGYDRYQIKLHKQAGKLLQEWSDVIGFAQLESFTRMEKKNDFAKSERALASTSGRRILHLAGSPAFDAGNRYGLPEQIDFTWSAYADALGSARK